jgi:hypothetical protein
VDPHRINGKRVEFRSNRQAKGPDDPPGPPESAALARAGRAEDEARRAPAVTAVVGPAPLVARLEGGERAWLPDLAVDVKIIFTPPCIFCESVENH